MVHAPDALHTSAYIVNKLKLADGKRDMLANELTRLVKLSYENGSREGDSIIRKKIKAVVDEINLYYRNIQAFISGKGGDTEAFADILLFFNARYLEEFQLTVQLDQIKHEIANQEKLDQDYNATHPGKNYVRKQNIFAKLLSKDLTEWELRLLKTVIPLLRNYLVDINDIVLYYEIENCIKRLITHDNIFPLSGADYQSFKKDFLYYLDLHIKLAHKPVSIAEGAELINQLLQQMGFRGVILKCQNITLDKYKGILDEITKEGNLEERSRKYMEIPSEAASPVPAIEDKRDDIATIRRNILRVLEHLCNLEEMKVAMQSGRPVSAETIAGNEPDRYIFHKPGTFDISLKFVSEYLRNSMIMVIDWLQREIQKSPNSIKILTPVLACVPSIQQFVSRYKLALVASTDKKGRLFSGSGQSSREDQYIPKRIAKELAETIYDNCHKIRQSLNDAFYDASKTRISDPSGILSKKIRLIIESFEASSVKITKGLSQIEKL